MKRVLLGSILFVILVTPGIADTQVGAYLTARGFLSLGITVEHDFAATSTLPVELAARGTLELPLGFDIQMPGIPAGRLSLGTSATWTRGWLQLEARPDLVFIWHAQELGSYRSIGTALDMVVGMTGDSGSYVGALLGFEHRGITHYSPSAYVIGTFDGLSQEAPQAGWFAGTAFDLRIGVDGRIVGRSFTFAGRTGIRLQPGSVAPLFSGFPLGNLPFFFELGATGHVAK